MPPIALDDVDRRILAELQADGRLSNVALADRVNLSPSPCLRRVRRLEEEGVIRGYRAEVDRAALGLGLTVFVDLYVERQDVSSTEGLQDGLLALPEVVSCHIVSGEADYLLEVIVRDLAHYERLMLDTLQALPGVTHVRSNFAISTVKSHAPLPVD